MAVDASNVSVVLGASSFGPGVVVTSAGIVFAQAASAPGATSAAYWYYNGTSLVGNVPTGKTFAFQTAGGTQLLLTVAANGSSSIGSQFTSSSALGAPLFFDTASATVSIGMVAATGMTFDVPAAKAFIYEVNNVEVMRANASGLRVATAMGLSVGGVTSVKTTDYVATSADFLVLVDVATTGDVAVTLPAANAAKGQVLMVKATTLHVSRDININRAGADTITTSTAAGATTLQLSPTVTYNCAVLVSDGTATWYVVNLM